MLSSHDPPGNGRDISLRCSVSRRPAQRRTRSQASCEVPAATCGSTPPQRCRQEPPRRRAVTRCEIGPSAWHGSIAGNRMSAAHLSAPHGGLLPHSVSNSDWRSNDAFWKTALTSVACTLFPAHVGRNRCRIRFICNIFRRLASIVGRAIDIPVAGGGVYWLPHRSHHYKLRHWPPGTGIPMFVPPFFCGAPGFQAAVRLDTLEPWPPASIPALIL